MKQEFYKVLEDRILLNGEFSPVVQHFIGDVEDTDPETGVKRVLTAEARALSRYHAVCSAAALSVIPYHSVQLLHSDGFIKEQMVIDRRANTPEQPEQAEE